MDEKDKSTDIKKSNLTVGIKGEVMKNCTFKNVRFDGYDTVMDIGVMDNVSFDNFSSKSLQAMKLIQSIEEEIENSQRLSNNEKNEILASLNEIKNTNNKTDFLGKYTKFTSLIKTHIELYPLIAPLLFKLLESLSN